MKKARLLLIAIASIFSMISFANPAQHETSQFSADQVKQIQKIVHDYLVTNPQVLVEASQALQAQQEKQMQSAAIQAIQKNKDALFNSPASPAVGNKNAAVTLVEFFDYQCGHCRAMADIVKQITDKDKNVRVIFKELPIFGGNSKYAAQAALAAMEQGKYYPFHNLLFKASGPLSKNLILKLAKKAGLDVDKLKADIDSATVKKEIDANFALAKELKIMGTPTFVLSNKAETEFRFIPGATSQQNLEQQIQSLQ